MNISRPNKYKKSRAQAMVEFALALPILLTLLYGLLETGRLLFIYASTVTAARQAARYGSATGNGPNGMPYYQDCDGIEGAARNVGFINTFESIDIDYDAGLDSSDGTTVELTPADPDCGIYDDPVNGDRIVVTVSALWQPIVPIVPLEPFEITSQSARTILASVSISVTAVPGYWKGSEDGYLELTSVVGSPDPYSFVGQEITYTYTLENTGTGDLDGPFSINDNIATTTCSGATDPLPPNDPTPCTGIYHITQADLDAGSVTNTAVPLADGVSFPSAQGIIIVADGLDQLTLSKSASPTTASVAGTIITYTYTLTNTGKVTLFAPYNVEDNRLGTINCSETDPLEPNASIDCTASHAITDDEISDGSVVNQAVASAIYPTDPVLGSTTTQSNSDTATVYTTDLVLIITPSSPTATLPNQVITYTYSVSNSSGSAVNSLSITDSRVTTVSCLSTTVPANGSTSCTGPYTVTQTDFDTGGTIVNIATASGNNGAVINSNEATASVAITQTAALSAAVSASPSEPESPATTIPEDTPITYTYTLTNTGNVTLSSTFSVAHTKGTTTDMFTCADQSSMIPGDTKTCTGTYAVTPDDVVAGSINSTGIASAKFGAQTVTSSPTSATVITYSGARFSIDISADPTSITQAGTSVVFTYTITNTGGTLLTSPYSITSSLLGSFSCAGTSPLAPGASTSCQNSYDASSEITNSITAATAMNGGSPVDSSNLDSVTVPYNVCNSGNLSLGNPVQSGNSFTWTITNSAGTLTINSITVSWQAAGNRWLDSVQLPAGTTIWSGPDKDGFLTISGSWSITGNTNLVMVFTKDTTLTDMNLTFAESGCGPLNNP